VEQVSLLLLTNNAETPNIGLQAVRLILQVLWSHPSDWSKVRLRFSFRSFFLNNARHSKVGDLWLTIVCQQDVSCCQVAMHDIARMEMTQSEPNLQCILEFLLVCEALLGGE
jgi:hypothetical protein